MVTSCAISLHYHDIPASSFQMAPISMLILNLTRIPWGVFSLLQWAPSKCIYRPGLHKSVTRNDLERNTKPFGEYCRSFKKSSVASKNMLRRGLLDGAGGSCVAPRGDVGSLPAGLQPDV